MRNFGVNSQVALIDHPTMVQLQNLCPQKA